MPLRIRTLKELLTWKSQPRREVISCGILPHRARLVIFGEAGTWKSMLTMELLLALAEGRPWIGFDTAKSSSLYVQCEIPAEDLQARFWQRVMADHPGEESSKVLSNGHLPEQLWEMTEPEFRLDQGQSFLEFQQALRRLSPNVLVLDPLYRLYSGNLSENYQVQPLIDRLDRLITAHDLSLVLIHHTKKLDLLLPGQTRDWATYLFGGSYLYNWVDTAIAIERKTDTVVRLHFAKTRHARMELPPIDVEVSRQTLRFRRAIALL